MLTADSGLIPKFELDSTIGIDKGLDMGVVERFMGKDEKIDNRRNTSENQMKNVGFIPAQLWLVSYQTYHL